MSEQEAAGAALILNVDDLEVGRYAKTRTLRHAGFQVVEADSGRQALQMIEDLQPALVLLDVRLPDVSGIEVCRAIKSRWPGVMVLQTSATFTSSADRIRGLEGGADAYLVQPIDPDELVASVRALLRLHAAEEARRQLNESLEQRIRERTRELRAANVRLMETIAQRERAEAALVQAQKMEAVGQLTGAMAHDFSNLLAGITGYLHLIRRKSSDATIAQYAEKGLAGAERGSKLIARLLAFARTERMVNQAVNCAALLRSMEEWLRQTVGASIRLEIRIGRGDQVAITEASQFELAVLNLVINARDAMEQGGSIRISLQRHRLEQPEGDLQPGRYIVVEVADDGPGMPPDVAQKAFEPFFTTKPVGRGTGLGLSQVYSLGKQSGGTARLRSAPGQGTTVSVWLRAGQREQLIDEQDAPAGEPRGNGERILIVDDNVDVLRTLSTALEDAGYAPETTSEGERALQIVEASPPRLVLLDFAMPEITGAEVAASIRRAHPNLPIIFVTGHADIGALEAAVGGVQLLRKPFRFDEVAAVVQRALQREAPRPDAAS